MAFIEITVPAAGQSKSFELQGQSVLVLAAPAYQNVLEAPKLSFNQPGDDIPLFQGGKWPKFGERFQQIQITGTSESAGDTLQLLSTNVCIDADPGITGDTLATIAGTTQSKAASDVVQSFSEAELQDVDGNLPERLIIYVIGGATRGINYAFNSNPSQGYPPTDSYYWDNEQAHGGSSQQSPMEPLEIEGIDWILSFSFIASVLGETPDLIWTPDY